MMGVLSEQPVMFKSWNQKMQVEGKKKKKNSQDRSISWMNIVNITIRSVKHKGLVLTLIFWDIEILTMTCNINNIKDYIYALEIKE